MLEAPARWTKQGVDNPWPLSQGLPLIQITGTALERSLSKRVACSAVAWQWALTHACIPRCFRVLLHLQRREIILVIQGEPLPGFKHTQARRIPVTDSLVTAERTHWRPPTGDNGGTLRTGDAKHRIIDAGFATLQLQNHGPQTTHYRTVAGRFMASREASYQTNLLQASGT